MIDLLFDSSTTEKLQQQLNSPEYHQSCQRFQPECQRLEDIAKTLQQRRSALQRDCDTLTVRRELASGSNLHRGFYCPSPVVDVVIGNTHRGKILKRITSRSKPSHEYGFNANGQLLWCVYGPKHPNARVEYLVYEGNTIYGITFDSCGHPDIITEEVYHDRKLTSYMYGLCVYTKRDICLSELTCEYYDYDEAGLCSFQNHRIAFLPKNPPDYLKDLIPPICYEAPVYNHSEYLFQRENGYLSSFTTNGHTYPALVQRKA